MDCSNDTNTHTDIKSSSQPPPEPAAVILWRIVALRKRNTRIQCSPRNYYCFIVSRVSHGERNSSWFPIWIDAANMEMWMNAVVGDGDDYICEIWNLKFIAHASASVRAYVPLDGAIRGNSHFPHQTKFLIGLHSLPLPCPSFEYDKCGISQRFSQSMFPLHVSYACILQRTPHEQQPINSAVNFSKIRNWITHGVGVFCHRRQNDWAIWWHRWRLHTHIFPVVHVVCACACFSWVGTNDFNLMEAKQMKQLPSHTHATTNPNTFSTNLCRPLCVSSLLSTTERIDSSAVNISKSWRAWISQRVWIAAVNS